MRASCIPSPCSRERPRHHQSYPGIFIIDTFTDTPSKKLEFYINNSETGLKKSDFNISTNNDEIDDLNDDIKDHYNNDLIDDMYNNIDHDNVDQKQTTHNSLYALADNQL